MKRITRKISKLLSSVSNGLEKKISFFQQIKNHGLPKKRTGQKVSYGTKKMAFVPVRADILPFEARRQWLFVRGSAILILGAFLGVCFFLNILISRKLAIIPLIERSAFLSKECERLTDEVARSRRHISSGGVHVLGKLPKPKAYLPPPWDVPAIIDTFCFEANETGVRISSLEYSTLSSFLGQVQMSLWWPYSPRDLEDPLTKFIDRVGKNRFNQPHRCCRRTTSRWFSKGFVDRLDLAF